MRLVTRGDFDGLACAAIIISKEKIDDILLTHPQEIANKTIEITTNDILANLPYDSRCGKWFDHRLLTESDEKPPEDFDGKFGLTPSAAQLVWEYYGKDPVFEELVRETNRYDGAQLERDDILNPKGYVLLGFTLDSRTGLGSYHSYFRQCVDWVRTLPVEEILKKSQVRQRARRMREEDENFRRALLAHTRLDGNVIFTDLRSYLPPPIGNRFLVYVLFPEGNVSLRLHWGPNRRFLVAAVAHSVLNRTCRTSIGELMTRFGGGGHGGAGAAELSLEEAEESVAEILQILKQNG